ncbi:MAG: T9SS type A sorting domain-containing protein [Bacteroidia bacterium]
MTNSKFLTYSRRMLGILFLLPTVLWAQKPANYVFTSSSGTFTSIVQGTNAVLVAKASGTSGAASIDDVIYNLTASTIPFTFTYDSVGYTGLNISTNGFITFGATAPSSTSGTPLSATTTYAGAISAFGRDLNGLYTSTDTGQIWYSVEGTTPNREFVIEWANVKNYTTTTTDFHKMSIQIRLHENNSIRFVYKYAAVGSPTTTALTPQVGLRGANNTFASNVNNRLMVAGQNGWSESYPGTANSSTMRMDPNYYFADGQTYTFTPPVACNGTPSVSSIMGVAYSCGVTLNLYNNSASYFDHYGYAYSWQESTDGTNYSAVSTGTVGKGTYSRTTVALPLYFRVRAICTTTSDTGYSTAVQIQNPDTVVKKWASLPYATSYQSDWLNGACFNGEKPDSAWIIYPRTGNNSWRRNDYGTQASWSSISGAYSPTGANSTTRSARFHSYNATSGSRGAMYFHFDASTLSGNKQVSFSYINTSGSDSLFVSLSTDTGQTYTQIGAYGIASAWTNPIINLGSLTQTRCILKFEGKSDAGTTDIGFDELEVDLVPSKELAAQVFTVPNGIGCIPDSSVVKMFIKNTATTNLNFATDTAMIQASFNSTYANIHLNSGTLNAGDSMEVSLFSTMYTGGTAGFTITAAIKFPGDGNAANDSIGLFLRQDSLYSLPYTQSFSATGPSDWSFTGFTYNSTAGNGGGGAYRHNLYGGNSNQARSPLTGPLTATSYVKFDYRAIDYSGGGATQLKTGDSIFVSVSTDCGLTRTLIYTIDSSTHAPTTAYTTLDLSLGSYSGSNVRVYINGKHTAGNGNDYYFSIDNFSVYNKPALDMAMSAIVSPNPTSCNSSGVSATVRVKNNGASTIDFSSHPVYLTMDITGAQTINLLDTLNSGTLASGATLDVTLATNLNFTQTGVSTVRAWLSTASDPDATNDTAANVSIERITSASLPYSQGFENLATLNNWLVQQVSGTGNWSVLTTAMTHPTLSAATGSNFLYFNSYSFSQGVSSRAMSPCLNLTGTDNPYLSFKLSKSSAYVNDPDSLYIQYSVDGGSSWTSVAGFTRLDTGASTPYWQEYSVCLPMLANTDNVRVALLGVSSYGDNFGVDDLSLKDIDLTTSLQLTTDTMCLGDSNYAVLSGSHSNLFYMVYTDASFSGGVTGNNSGTVSVALNGLSGGTHTIKVYAMDTVANCGAYLYDSATVKVNTPYFISVGPDTSFCDGDSILLQSTAGHLNYRWNTNDLGPDLWISTAGTFIIYAEDSNSCALSDTLVASIDALPTPNLGNDTSFCETFGFTLNAGTFDSYLWNDNSNGQTLFVSAGGDYSVTVTNAAGCSATDSVFLIMNPAPATVLLDATICADSFVIYDGGSGYASYLWTRTNDSGQYTVGQPGLNILVVTTALGCSKTDTAIVTVNALPAVDLGADIAVCVGTAVNLSSTGSFQSYLWSDSTNASTLGVSNGGTYWLLVYDGNGCKNTDSIEVVFSKPPVDLGPDTGFCVGGSFALDAGNSTFSYVWSTSPNDVNPTLIVSAAGQYSVVVTDSINCTNTDTVEVIEYSLPNVNIGADQAICFGDSALFAEMDRPVLYNWNNGVTDSLAYYTQAGTVILRITDMNGCINRDTAELTVNSLPSPNIGPDTAICAGHDLVLSPGTIFAGYLWSTGSGASTITVSTAATYSLTVTDANGCQGSDQMVLSVNALPDATFTFIDNGQNLIAFNASDTLKGFFWRFGDGDTSTTDDVQHQYPGQGSYTVTLYVLDSNYCLDSTTQSLSLTSIRNTFSSRLDVNVYPNPTSNLVQVSMDLETRADLHIELYDIQGKLLQTITTPSVQGEHLETLDLSGLAPGNYTLRVMHGSDLATFKVVKVQR